MISGGNKPEQSVRRPIVKNFGCCNAKGWARCSLGRHIYWAAFRKNEDRIKGRKSKDTK